MRLKKQVCDDSMTGNQIATQMASSIQSQPAGQIRIHLVIQTPGKITQVELNGKTPRLLMSPWATEVEFIVMPREYSVPTKDPIEKEHLDKTAWKEFLSNCKDIDQFVIDVSCCGLEMALRAHIDRYINLYTHQACGSQWEETHNNICSDLCPVCGKDQVPSQSRVIRRLSRTQTWAFTVEYGHSLESSLDPQLEVEVI